MKKLKSWDSNPGRRDLYLNARPPARHLNLAFLSRSRRQHPPMVRHVSDLSWRITAALGNSVRRSESSVSVGKVRGNMAARVHSDKLPRKMSRGDSQSDEESYSEEIFESR